MIECPMCFLIVNIIVIELSIIFQNSSLFKNAGKTCFILFIDADGLMFSRLIRSLHCKAVVITVSYVKEYNTFGSGQYCLF